MKTNQKRFFNLKERDIKKHLRDELLKEDRVDGKVKELKILMPCRLRYFGGKPWRWEVGFCEGKGIGKAYYRAEIDYNTSDIVGIVRLERPFNADKSIDMVYLMPPELIAKRRWQEYNDPCCIDEPEEMEVDQNEN